MNNSWTMKATVLGWCGGFPRSGEATCGILVETSEGSVLLDCGSGVLSRYFGASDVDQLGGLLISHLHYDHMADLGCLQYSINHAMRVGMRREKLPVYVPDSPKNMWNAIQYPYTDSIAVTDGMEFELAGMRITAKKVEHTIECYAFRLEKDGKSIVYYTDTVYLPDGKDFINGTDLLFCEATISEGTRHSTGKGHMTDMEAGRSAREGNAKALCLYHLPSDGDLLFMRERAAAEFGKPVLTPDLRHIYYV